MRYVAEPETIEGRGAKMAPQFRRKSDLSVQSTSFLMDKNITQSIELKTFFLPFLKISAGLKITELRRNKIVTFQRKSGACTTINQFLRAKEINYLIRLKAFLLRLMGTNTVMRPCST